MTVRGVHPLHSLRARGPRQSRRAHPLQPKRNGYPARSREEEAYRGPVALPYATGGQYVDRLSGEPARLHAAEAACRRVAAANPGYPLLCANATGEQQKRS